MKNPIPKNTIFLWFNKDALEAARFYAATFPDSQVKAVHPAPSDYPSGKTGDILTVEFTVLLALPASASTAARLFRTARPSPFKSRPTLKRKLTGTGTRSSVTAARKALAAGVRIAGDCPGRSPPAPSPARWPQAERRPSASLGR